MRILANLNHKNVAKLVGIGQQAKVETPQGSYIGNFVYIVMDYVGNDLFNYLEQHGPVDEETARFLLSQMLDALEHVHNKGIVHRDIKPENMLIDNH